MSTKARTHAVLEHYRQHVKERAAEGIVPKPLNADQVAELINY
jgi:Aconitase B